MAHKTAPRTWRDTVQDLSNTVLFAVYNRTDLNRASNKPVLVCASRVRAEQAAEDIRAACSIAANSPAASLVFVEPIDGLT